MNPRPFNVVLREVREASGLTLKDLASVLGISARLLHDIETAKSVPSLLERVGMCTLLGISGYGGPPPGRNGAAVASVLLTTRKALLDALSEVEKLRVS